MIGQTVSHYRILEPLGEGGMGVVYLAEDIRLNRKVVLKFLQPRKSSDALARERFMQEAKAASSLNSPAICTIYDIGETDDDRMFIAMAHYEGKTLASRIRRGTIDVKAAIGLAAQIGRGLAHAHAGGIVHRDIKPANIIVTRPGRAVILDFGIAKLMNVGRLTSAGALLGTIDYMSPEQAEGRSVGPPTDVWSLGVVLYEMLCGVTPFGRDYDQATIYSIINEPAPDIASVVDRVPVFVADFVRNCLSKDADDRPELTPATIELLDRETRLPQATRAAGSRPTITERGVGARTDDVSGTGAATLTLFFSDLEGSTRLLDTIGSEYADVLERVREVIRLQLEQCAGEEIDTAGDGLFAVFTSARDAVRAAVEIQRAMAASNWPKDATVKVRIGMHTGEPVRLKREVVGMDVHRAARICAAAHGGQILISSATQTLLAEGADDDISCVYLGEYTLKDISTPERLFQVAAPGIPAQIQRPRAHGAGGELPATLTDLIGRERELSELRTLLLSSARLITLTGPGGTGKTRLAIEAARSSADAFRHGVRFVALAAVSEPERFRSAVAHELGIRENPDRSLDQSLEEHLHDRQMLLVLDNFEQLIDAAPQVAELISTTSDLTVLATSRIPLRVAGEREYRVPTLGFPDSRELRAGFDSAAFASLRLFEERARMVRPDFELAGNEEAVGRICARVDGLPLAIELAAARSRLFTPEALLQRLDRTLDVLQTRGRDVPDRHQTLRSAIAWSYDLLHEEEKRLFGQLAIFSGGWTLEAAASVCSVAGGPRAVEDGLESLLERSLVREADVVSGIGRFEMLETIREFAAEKLAQSGREPELRALHARYYATLAEIAEPMLVGPDQDDWLDRLEAEHDNFRSALEWCIESRTAQVGMSLGSSLWRFWAVRGYLVQGRRWLERLLELPFAAEATVNRARLLNALGTIAHEIGDYSESEKLLQESLGIFRSIDDEVGKALVLTNLGWVACELSHFGLSRKLSAEAFYLNRVLEDVRGQALALNNLGWSATYQTYLNDAEMLHVWSADLRREIGDDRGVAFSQTNIGWVYRLQGRIDLAIQHFDEAIETLKHLKDRQLQGLALGLRAVAVWDSGETGEAIQTLRNCIDHWERVGNKWGIGWSHCMLAFTLLEARSYAEAASHASVGHTACQQTEGLWGIGLGLSARAATAAATGNIAAARRNFAEAIRTRLAIGNALGVANSIEDVVAWIALPSGHDATDLAKLALAIRREVGTPPPERHISLYEMLGIPLPVFPDWIDLSSARGNKDLPRHVIDPPPHKYIQPAAETALEYLADPD